MVTPVSAYMKLRDDYPQSALMESSDYHGGDNARSFIALHPIASISIEHGVAISRMPNGEQAEHAVSQDYQADRAINDFLQQFSIEGTDHQFCGLSATSKTST